MRECRRRIDLDALPPLPQRPAEAPCLHFIAAWGGARGSLAEEVLTGLDGNRELLIRNLRPAEVDPARLQADEEAIEQVVRHYAQVVDDPAVEDGGAVFGDVFERNDVSRALASLILGPDPMARPR